MGSEGMLNLNEAQRVLETTATKYLRDALKRDDVRGLADAQFTIGNPDPLLVLTILFDDFEATGNGYVVSRGIDERTLRNHQNPYQLIVDTFAEMCEEAVKEFRKAVPA